MLAATLIGGFGCRTSELDERQAITENLPSTLMLNISGGKFSTVATRTSQNEGAINSIALFVFNSKGKLLTRSFFDNLTTDQIRVRTFSGNDMRVVAVANYKSIDGLEEQLNAVANYDVLNDVVVTQSVTSSAHNAGIVMTGETLTDIIDSPSGTAISIAMQYAVAKVTLSIKVSGAALPANESIEIFNVALGSIATRGLLMASSVEPADRAYVELSSVDYVGNQTDGLTATFYVLENVRGGRAQIAAPSGMLEQSGNGHLFKRHFAPDHSSYAMISANHRIDGNRSKRVDFYLYFGHNDSDNYNVGRGENHTYSIKINGLNNVNVDTNVETSDYSFELGYGDNLNMDGHADNRSLRFGKSAGQVSVEVVDQNGRRAGESGFNATWVKLSPIDLTKHQVRLQKGNGSKGEWQQDGGRFAIVRGKYIPHKSVREALPQGGWNNIPAGADDDDRMAFVDATYRMCYAISDIILQSDVELSIYADENMTGAIRSAKIEVRYRDANGQEQVELLPITQAPLYGVGSVNGYEMLVESFEEYAFDIYSSPAKQLSKHGGMHWGFYSNQIYSGTETAGRFLTANAVYGVMENSWNRNNSNFVQYGADGEPSWPSTIEYRSKYGASALTYNWDAYQGAITAPYYHPNYAVSFNAYAPIYNSSAARYCHEKNRDLNGDGAITPDEAMWYLPSAIEMAVIAQNMGKLPSSAQFNDSHGVVYWSSTERSSNMAVGYDFSSKEALQYTKNTPLRVRCVRRGQKVGGNDVYVDSNNSIIIDNTMMPADQITTTPKSLIPASANSAKTIASRFIIGRVDGAQKGSFVNAAGMSDHFLPFQLGDNLWSDKESGCAIYSELPGGSDKGKWRLPTLGELARIASLQGKLNAISGYTPMVSAWYWSVTEVPNVAEYNTWALNIGTMEEMNYDRRSQLCSRCIRQI